MGETLRVCFDKGGGGTVNITIHKDGAQVIDGTPEELVLYNKLSAEWDLYYGELKARGMLLE